VHVSAAEGNTFREVRPGLMLRLDTPLPASLPAGRGTAVFCSGGCFHRSEEIRQLDLLVDGRPYRPAAWRMPRLDLFELSRGEPGSYRSGFWAVLPLDARDQPGAIDISLRVELHGGRQLVAALGRTEIVLAEPPPPPDPPPSPAVRDPIAICMATFEPDAGLFQAQLDSLRAQTDRDWICLISDDCSGQERFAEIRGAVGEDPRFALSRSPVNLGPYRNFERALAMVPPEADLVALCDQDDRWYADKLRVLRGALGSARLVYSDQRLVDGGGRVLRETMWEGRRNNHHDLASLLVANTVTGAASLFRREVAELARPFPDTPGWQFHDHWLALVAMATGEVAYVDRPLYDYVQHEQAILGQVTGGSGAGPLRRLRVRRPVREARAAYFYGYLAAAVKAEALLARCSGELSPAKRRVLTRFLDCERNPLAFAWLAVRPLRRLSGANETLGSEAELAQGIAWRHLVETLAARSEEPGRIPLEAACPPLEADTLGQSRLARWRRLS
jgi:glycosyltransferase involved in cell wall biosynthesis